MHVPTQKRTDRGEVINSYSDYVSVLLDVVQCQSTRKIGHLQENDQIVHYRIEKSARSNKNQE